MNISLDSCVRPLGTSDVITSWFRQKSENFKYITHNGFELSLIGDFLIQDEPILSKVHALFPIKYCSVIKMEPNRTYNWHRDWTRGVSINLLLTPDARSNMLFGWPIENNRDQYDFREFVYQPNTLYLFNTQIHHTVVNYDQQRYLFTVQFEQDKQSLRYENIVAKLPEII